MKRIVQMAELLETVLDGSPARRRIATNTRQQSTTSQGGTVASVDQHLPSYEQVQPTPTKPREAANAGEQFFVQSFFKNQICTQLTDEISFSLDLLAASQREANFLRMIDRKAPILYEEDVIRNAIRRYESCWLPLQVCMCNTGVTLHLFLLQATHRDTNIIPPLDVHWIWHCHMLSPTHYRQDCESLVGCVVDHKLLSSDEIQQRYEHSVKVMSKCKDMRRAFRSAGLDGTLPDGAVRFCLVRSTKHSDELQTAQYV